jgi:hypothetical protein
MPDFNAKAKRLRALADRIAAERGDLDLSSYECECCGHVRYVIWPQKQLADKLDGAATRLTELAALCERRADDPEFNPK